MYTLLVLADDLTGALDTAVKFAQRGIPVQVLVRWKGPGITGETEKAGPPGAPLPDEGVLVINTNTRHSPAEAARSTVMRVLERYAAVPYVYKKTDSTLRGNIGAELEALVLGRKLRVLPFVPAYPDLGRHTRGGRQYLDSVPIDQTAMAKDALNPIRRSFIPGIIAEETALPVRLIPGGPAGAGAGPEIWIYDAEKNADLREIARTLEEQGLLAAAAGCAGFAESLADRIPFGNGQPGGKTPVKPVSSPKKALPPGGNTLPVLVVSGSRHPASLAQTEAALKAGIPGAAVDGDKLLNPRWFEGEEAASLISRCGELLDTGCCILGTGMSLGRTPPGKETKPVSGAGTEGWGAAGFLGRLAGPILRRRPAHLVVFGGDTLLGVTEFLGCPLLNPIDEILPGIVLAGTPAGQLIVTKSGAFGGPGLIAAILEFFRNLPVDAA
ncbi:MAG: four-carbon acid sugar kinase family protein [Treponema sp.]|jgi:uncharacterized protein YgbK (DUF1537 family)|nr:four-carbon acid sugar kinase family protein [Treponema sp.]